jgi:two-component system chemotaxis response regulator CheY
MNIKALIVDDVDFLALMLAKMMPQGSTTKTAASGDEAIKLYGKAFYAKEPYHLICLDIRMPNIDGVEVLEFIRKFEKDQNVAKENAAKIIMTTSVNKKETVIEVMQKGCDSYIIKPYNKERIDIELKKLALI